MLSKHTRRLLGMGDSGRIAPDKQEKALAGIMGGKVHKRSGAGLVKWDGSSDWFIWDAKHTDGDRIALPKTMLRQITMDAVSSGRVAFFELEYFQNRPPRSIYIVPWDSVKQYDFKGLQSTVVHRGYGGASASFGRALAAKLNGMDWASMIILMDLGWCVLNAKAFVLFRELVENAKTVND